MQLEGPEFTRMVREQFLYTLEMARGLHEPCCDWEGFVDALWRFLPRVFGVELDDQDS